MSSHKIGVPFLVLTTERKMKFLALALKGWKLISEHPLLSPRESGMPTVSGATSRQSSPARSVSPMGELSSESAASQNVERSTKALTVTGASGHAKRACPPHPARLRPAGQKLMPGERRNGHTLSCTCSDCRKLVEADAEQYFKRGLTE